MPRLRAPKDIHADLRHLFLDRMSDDKATFQDIAGAMTITAQTLSRKVHNPGKMTLDELRGVCLILGIDGKELSEIFMRW